MKNRNKLFKLLESLGFEQTSINDLIVFKKDEELFLFQKKHFNMSNLISTRYKLDKNGRISKEDFNKKFELYDI